MLATLLVAVAMATCLGVAALARGGQPTRGRLLGTTLLGIGAAVIAWMVIATFVTVPESGVMALGVFLIALSAGLARAGTRQQASGPA